MSSTITRLFGTSEQAAAAVKELGHRGFTDDSIDVIGPSGDAEIQPVDVARRRGTITNEVSTSFSSRLARVYTRGGAPVAVRSLLAGGR